MKNIYYCIVLKLVENDKKRPTNNQVCHVDLLVDYFFSQWGPSWMWSSWYIVV